MKNILMCTMVLLFACPGIGQASLFSGFDTSNEGWTTVGATSPVFSASGGNPEGFIYATDVTGSPSFANFGWGFFSPNAWDGNWGSYANGTIQFDLRPVGYNRSGAVFAILSGSNYMYMGVSGAMVNGTWTHFETQLTDANFTEVGATFSQILQNVTALYINGDLTTSFETTALDNVRVTAPVPLPATVWLLGSGLAGLVGTRLRKIKK